MAIYLKRFADGLGALFRFEILIEGDLVVFDFESELMVLFLVSKLTLKFLFL